MVCIVHNNALRLTTRSDKKSMVNQSAIACKNRVKTLKGRSPNVPGQIVVFCDDEYGRGRTDDDLLSFEGRLHSNCNLGPKSECPLLNYSE